MKTYFNEQSHVDVLWEEGYTGKRVKVGIVDTGISASEITKIKKSIVCGHNFSLDGSPRNDFTSSTHHGYAVASLVLSVAPKAKLVIAKVLDDEGMGNPRRTARGIRYCIDKKCDIINCSIAGPADIELERAINEAYNKGIIVVAATGNDGKNTINYPEGYMRCLSVGSISRDYHRSEFSNYNAFMTLLAPGENISFKINNEEIIDSGTSYSAPLVSGTLALLKEKLKCELGRKPKYDEIHAMLVKNCVIANNIKMIEQGCGYLDFEAKGGNINDFYR